MTQNPGVSSSGGGGGNVNLNQVNGATISLGQTTKSASLPVTIASDDGVQTGIASIATNTGNSATSANQTNGTQQAKITNGTNIADVVANDTGYNGQPVNNATKTLAFTTSTPGAQNILANTDCRGYSWVEIVYSSVGSGLALTGQFSPSSGGTYMNSSTFSQSPGSPTTSALGTTVAVLYAGPVRGNFFQIAVSALTSGTFSGTITLRAIAPTTTTQNINGTVTATVSGGVQLQTGTITTSASAITSGALNGNGAFAQVTIHGTYAGISFGITVSDDGGTTFYNTPVYDTNNQRWLMPGAVITPGTNASNTYVIPIFGNTNEVKVLASAYTSGTANIRICTSSGGIDPGSRMAQIMDAAGNARGANVTAAGALVVDGSAVTQPISGSVGTATAVVNVGQKTVGTSATQISASSTVPTNGIIIGALSTNSASIFIGGSGVTTSNGAELVPGGSLSFSCNLNTLYIISAASTTDKVYWNVA